MLPSANRLKAYEAEKVKKEGNLMHSVDFSVIIRKKDKKEKSKFGVIVSKKVASLAVHRNRIKRAIFEAVRRNIDRVPTGYDMIFLPKSSIAKKMTDEIMREVEGFLKRKFQ